jgi:ribose transport system substrate-binding protein
MVWRTLHRWLTAATLGAAVAGSAGFLAVGPVQAATQATHKASSCYNPFGFHDPKAIVGVSYAFLGNSWRRTMQQDLTQAIQQAIACHEIGGVVYTYAGNSTAEQISQIDDLILKHVSVILVDASSTTGLNAVIAKATKAGIPVVNFDTPVTAPQAYVLNWNWVNFGKLLANYMVQRLHGQGNVLFVRGLAGTTIDQGEYQGWKEVLSHYPKIHIVGTVYGNWDEATAESAVASLLPSLPKVDAVFVNGGGYGVLSAFAAAHRPLPLVVGGNRGAFLRWWWAHRNTYQTFSYSSFPQCGVLAFYVAQFLLKGTHVSHQLWLQPLVIQLKDLPQYKNTPPSAVADAHFTVNWVYQNLIQK